MLWYFSNVSIDVRDRSFHVMFTNKIKNDPTAAKLSENGYTYVNGAIDSIVPTRSQVYKMLFFSTYKKQYEPTVYI